ncbi:hypothetical protein MHIB_25030 [Mycolicibacter hiberniae]|uniref:Uncharacterized protein n=1 Tax=Mycolicibacter hiberniae TaxID=29314 RepID=A0A7I7X4F8_9MYCO|nr:hypothetical protein MHIB_25030 [Mycolicibacter hiberniae]
MATDGVLRPGSATDVYAPTIGVNALQNVPPTARRNYQGGTMGALRLSGKTLASSVAIAGLATAAVVIVAGPGSAGPASADPESVDTSETVSTPSTTGAATTTISESTSVSAPATGN